MRAYANSPTLGYRPYSAAANARPQAAAREAASLGVTVEAEYTVGEYDIVVLSAKESEGL
jgi:hypothetical protein